MPAAIKLSLDDQVRIKIKRWILASGKTQVEIAAAIGHDRSWLSRYMSGEYDADLTTLEALAQLFGQSIATLFLPPGKAVTVLNDDETRLIENCRASPPRSRQTLLAVSEETSKPARLQTPNRPPRARAG